VTVTADVLCPDKAKTRLVRTATVDVSTASTCCGPDFTDAYVDALNRIIRRLPLEAPAHGTLTSDATLEFERWFMRNGPYMMFRPFNGLGVFDAAAGGCPSSKECADTATLLGRCVETWWTDAVIYGITTGFVGLEDWAATLAGKVIKFWHYFTKEAWTRAEARTRLFWEIGYEIGRTAHRDPDFRLDRSSPYLERIAATASRADVRLGQTECHPCTKPPPPLETAFRDWSVLKWDKPDWNDVDQGWLPHPPIK
jgi:hypothetical protein